jgi:hypothetical protein
VNNKTRGLTMIQTIRQANEITGGLSRPSKMPCPSFSIPAQECKTGAKLVNVKGSVCHGCYAMKGNYKRFAKTITPKLYERFNKLSNDQWVDGMVYLINKRCINGYFRWHDSGDIQSIEHLNNIVEVCKLTPNIKHWIPTREYKIVKQYTDKNGSFPDNLTVRLSAHMIEGKAPNIANLPTSEVSANGYNCPSYKQGNKCLDCRKCWNPSIKNITYKLH